jgi:hypothetical protein
MIPFIKMPNTGMMQRHVTKTPVVPDISPDIQGLAAINLLDDKQRGLLKYALKNEAKIIGCNESELRWAFGKKVNGVAPLKIWYPKKPTIIQRIKEKIGL